MRGPDRRAPNGEPWAQQPTPREQVQYRTNNRIENYIFPSIIVGNPLLHWPCTTRTKEVVLGLGLRISTTTQGTIENREAAFLAAS